MAPTAGGVAVLLSRGAVRFAVHALEHSALLSTPLKEVYVGYLAAAGSTHEDA